MFTLNSFHKAKQSTKLIMWKYLKRLREAVRRERPELWPNDWILHRDDAPAHEALPSEQLVAQKSIPEVEHALRFPDMVPNDL
jgi:hypothetical protein